MPFGGRVLQRWKDWCFSATVFKRILQRSAITDRQRIYLDPFSLPRKQTGGRFNSNHWRSTQHPTTILSSMRSPASSAPYLLALPWELYGTCIDSWCSVAPVIRWCFGAVYRPWSTCWAMRPRSRSNCSFIISSVVGNGLEVTCRSPCEKEQRWGLSPYTHR